MKISRSQGFIDQGDDVPCQPALRNHDNTNTSISRVGAFSVEGIGGAASFDVSSSIRSNPAIPTEAPTVSSTQGSTIMSIINARVVDEESPSLPLGPVIEAMPLDEYEPTESQHLKALFKSRKCRFLSALAVALGVALIVGVVLLTQNSSEAPNSETQAARNEFLAALKPMLSNESLTALENPDSPQSLSLRWLLERSNFGAWPFDRQVQRYAMATIYYATAGPSWSNGGNWLTNETECQWFQGSVKGDFCGENGMLLMLNQTNNALNGNIPDEIRFLSSLITIDLSVNKLFKSIPSESIGNFPSLQVLNLSNNALSGHVPGSIGLLSSVSVIDLRANKLIGTMPADILGNVTALQVLDLSNNLFNGTLTSSIDALTALQSLDLSSNPFAKGPLPSEIGQLTKLTHLYLTRTSLSSQIPNELGLLTMLQYLSLGSNSMNGTIPTQLFDCTQLTTLSLQYNSFAGTLPSEVGRLTDLTWVWLDANSLTGTVPSEFGSLTALTLLTLDRNDFNGSVPAEVCDRGTIEVHRGCSDVLECDVSCCPYCYFS